MLTILALPLCAAVVSLCCNSRRLDVRLMPAIGLLHLACACWLAFAPPGRVLGILAYDPLSRLFLLVLSVLFMASSLYSADYLMRSKIEEREKRLYAPFLFLSLFAMTGVTLTDHLGLMWVFIEATTLFSAPLIMVHKTRHSLEASWKYLFICSVGIALAFIGLLLLALAGEGGERTQLNLAALLAQGKALNPIWLKTAFAFILVGYGTKAGLAPTHTWLPDAHAEAPAAISALLSGALLNCALLGILRFYQILAPTAAGGFARGLLMFTGLLSIFVCAVYVFIVKDYKRMLAYSSMENMGIIAVGVAAGGLGVLGAMLHLIGHSLTKASLFLTSGSILRRFASKSTGDVKGLLRADRPVGLLWCLGLLALIAMPPFASFLSELLIAAPLFAGGMYGQGLLFLALLAAVMAGLAAMALRMAPGEPAKEALAYQSSARERLFAQAPAYALLFLAVLANILLFTKAGALIREAAILLGGPQA